MPLSVDFSKMTSAEFVALTKKKLSVESDGNDEPVGDFILNPTYKDWVVNQQAKPSAVLIPIVEREQGLCVILTKRAEKLKSHSGQIAFPGGKVDAEDKNVEATALREAYEEIDLEPNEVEVIARLPEYFTGSGFNIAPIIGMVTSSASIIPSPDEVEYIFEVPLAFLMSERNFKKGSRVFKGEDRYFYEVPYNEHYIWGVTAGIIKLLADRLMGE